jgi:hypothetical protein
VTNPVRFYLDLLDGDAFDTAESGDWAWPLPALPLLIPWLLGGPLLALLPSHSRWSFPVFAVTAAASVMSFAAVGWFWLRRVEFHRRELEVVVEQPPKTLGYVILAAVALVSVAVFIWG